MANGANRDYEVPLGRHKSSPIETRRVPTSSHPNGDYTVPSLERDPARKETQEHGDSDQ